VGPLDVLTAEFVAKLGRGDNAKLLAMLSEVDTSRPLWAAVALEFIPANDAPPKILASLDPRGSGSGSGTLVFKNERGAARAAEGIAGDHSPLPFANWFSANRDGSTVTIQLKGSGPFMPRAVEAMFKARQMARETMSMNNLAQLAKATHSYAADNDGKMPPDLKALERYLDDMPKVLTSPLSKRKLPAGESDYVYIPLGNLMRIPDPTQTIMLYERPENHDGKGTIAVFVDGHVERLDMEKFKQLLKAAQALSAKQTAPK
jgi:prepilin-type processing-associated H-X9-DG protein